MTTSSPALRELMVGLRPHRASMAVALLLMLTEAAVELAYPVLLALLIDRGVVAGEPAQALWWGAAMLALAALSFACGIGSTFFASDAGQSFAADLRARLFRRLMEAPVRGFQRLAGPSLLTRLTSDVNQLQLAVFMCLRLYLRAPLIIAGAVAMAMLVDPWLALPLLLAAPPLAWALKRAMAHGLSLFQSAQQRLDRVTGLLGENLRGLWLIRAFDRRHDELRRFAEANAALAEGSAAAMRLSEMAVPALILLLNLCIVAILGIGAAEAGRQGGAGDAVAVLNYAFRIVGEFFYLPMILTNLGRARSALGRVAEVLALEPEAAVARTRPPAAPARAVAVEFEAVVVRHPGSHATVLGPVDFALEEGGMLAIVGATGSGKSTLLQLLPGLFAADGGRVRVAGRDLREWPLPELRRRIGYVPQTAQLASGTVREVLAWGIGDVDDARIRVAARAAQIHEHIAALPEGYATRLDPRGANLSGGQRQRLALARALLRRPALLLLDDCTSALDAATSARLLEAIGRLDCTVLFATQKLAVARRADAVLLLEREGGLQGGHDELLRRSPTYRQWAGSQAAAAGVPVDA